MKKDKKKRLGATLQQLLNEHRLEYPEDRRDDDELFNSVMEHLIAVGLVEEGAGGFILSDITRDA